MILVILAICIVLIVGGLFLMDSDLLEGIGVVSAFVGVAGGIVSLIALVFLCVDASELKVIDERINMYQEENTKIEEQIATVVTQYQQHEKDIFTECSPETSMTLVSLYPELKSDTLVQQQITLYVENNKKIKELKEEEINGDVTRWWLYFGGSKKE